MISSLLVRSGLARSALLLTSVARAGQSKAAPNLRVLEAALLCLGLGFEAGYSGRVAVLIECNECEVAGQAMLVIF